jgi:hypothetical protein
MACSTVLVLLVISMNALTSDWRALSQEFNASVLIDIQSVVKKKNIAKAWVQYTYNAPQANPISPFRPLLHRKKPMGRKSCRSKSYHASNVAL